MDRAAPSYTIRDNIEKQRFEADLGDGSIAIAEYRLRDGTIIFTHTEVPADHEGQRIGRAPIRFALSEARARGLQVVPLCPFFAAYSGRHPEEQDLLAPEQRAALGLGA